MGACWLPNLVGELSSMQLILRDLPAGWHPMPGLWESLRGSIGHFL